MMSHGSICVRLCVKDDELSGVCHWSHGYDELWFYLCEIVYKE